MLCRAGTVLIALLALACSATAEEKEAAQARRLAVLIDELGNPQHAKREAAERALRQMGAPALAALREAVRSKDPEVRRRATRLVRRLEQQADAARLLAPVRVRFDFKDTPLPDAVADIAKKTGFAIKLEDADRLGERKVTVDTGEVSFWEAIDRFCEKAGLVEPSPAPLPRPGTTMTGSVIIFRGGLGRGTRLTPRDILTPDPAQTPALILAEGAYRSLPKHCAGAVRVRALPPDTKLPGQEPKHGEMLLTLEAKAGPAILWTRPVGLRIHKALDDQGQRLQQVAGSLSVDGPQGSRSGTMVVINQLPYSPRRNEPENQPQVPVRLKQGEKTSKMLKELSGTLVAQVQSPTETLVVVETILKAAGRSVKGRHGGSLKVGEVTRQDGGVKVRVLVESPPHQIDDGTTLDVGGRTVIIDGQEIGPKTVSLHASNFTLLDEKGKPLQVVKAITTGVRAGPAQEVELLYQPGDGQAAPARFLYTGRRGALVEVLFTLRNVPLR
jgi:hypothetical protein